MAWRPKKKLRNVDITCYSSDVGAIKKNLYRNKGVSTSDPASKSPARFFDIAMGRQSNFCGPELCEQTLLRNVVRSNRLHNNMLRFFLINFKRGCVASSLHFDLSRYEIFIRFAFALRKKKLTFFWDVQERNPLNRWFWSWVRVRSAWGAKWRKM